MPKSSKKHKTTEGRCKQKRIILKKKDKATSLPKKRTKVDKSNQIEKSQKLLLKSKKSKANNGYSNCKDNKLYYNGKPKPSLADLEKMFDDSSDETEVSKPAQCENNRIVNECTQSGTDMILDNRSLDFTVNSVDKRNTFTVNNCANHLPAVPQKGLPNNQETTVSNKCIDCESESLSENIDSRPKKKAKLQNNTEVQYFNNKSDMCISDNKNVYPIKRSDSDVTIIYDAEIPTLGTFCPLPSTSRDNETIQKNEINFSASFNSLNESQQDSESAKCCDTTYDENTEDVQIIEPTIEIITICDDISPIIDENISKIKSNDIQEPLNIDNEYCLTEAKNNETIDICDLSIKEIIKENKIVLNKYNLNNNLGKITQVTPNHMSNHIISSNTKKNIIKEPTVEVISLLEDYIPNILPPSNKQNGNNSNSNETTVSIYDNSINNRAKISMKYGPINNAYNYSIHKQIHTVILDDEDIDNQSSSTQNMSTFGRERVTVNVIERDRLNAEKISIMNTPDTEVIDDVSSSIGERNFGNCPICMDSFNWKTTASTLCGHIFCMNCIKSALKRTRKCPICRKYLKGNAYHPLFLN